MPQKSKFEIIHKEIVIFDEDLEDHVEVFIITELIGKKILGTYSVPLYSHLNYYGVKKKRYWIILN